MLTILIVILIFTITNECTWADEERERDRRAAERRHRELMEQLEREEELYLARKRNRSIKRTIVRDRSGNTFAQEVIDFDDDDYDEIDDYDYDDEYDDDF